VAVLLEGLARALVVTTSVSEPQLGQVFWANSPHAPKLPCAAPVD